MKLAHTIKVAFAINAVLEDDAGRTLLLFIPPLLALAGYVPVAEVRRGWRRRRPKVARLYRALVTAALGGVYWRLLVGYAPLVEVWRGWVKARALVSGGVYWRLVWSI